MRTYTQIGNEYEKEGIDIAIARTNWEDFRTQDLPFSQGECIKAVISQCHVPLKGIKRMCLHNVISKDGEQHGFYGIDVKYANGQAQLYIADNGVSSCIVASDFTPKTV